jgi:DNA-binding response OmpR family regulator
VFVDGALPAMVLVIEDDPTVADVVARYLERDGLSVVIEGDGEAGLRRALEAPPDLLVLDLMLPGMDGIEICRRVRAVSSVPIVMLTARGGEEDRIAGLDLGADDYISKPFSPRELAARVKAVLRRNRMVLDHARGQRGLVRAGDLELDLAAREAHRAGAPVLLTQLEFDLLAHFMGHPGIVFRREHLLEQVWGYRFGDTSTVTVHVRRLRQKVEADPAEPRHIKTVWGVGYRFEPWGGDGP